MKLSARHGRGAFVPRTIEALYQAMERALDAEHSAASSGLLQRLDARVKVSGLFALILATALATRLWVIAAIFALAALLAALSRISIRLLASRVWIPALAFTGAIAVPALFLTPGDGLYRVPGLNWTVTAQGLTTAGYLLLRVETAATLALLLVVTTPWMQVLKALRVFRIPVVFVAILGMTSRYILLLLETAHEMFESRKSRSVGALHGAERRQMAVASAGVLLSRTFQLSGDVYLAMQARGFRGEVYLLDDFAMKRLDWLALAGFAALAAAAVWAGR
ncbi:MAG TPA: cobalt ECF transporter T component CbiQ [Bryobacteraceae bacterium]|jgi:cobalt ECF transporter T component CbiQ